MLDTSVATMPFFIVSALLAEHDAPSIAIFFFYATERSSQQDPQAKVPDDNKSSHTFADTRQPRPRGILYTY